MIRRVQVAEARLVASGHQRPDIDSESGVVVLVEAFSMSDLSLSC